MKLFLATAIAALLFATMPALAQISGGLSGGANVTAGVALDCAQYIGSLTIGDSGHGCGAGGGVTSVALAAPAYFTVTNSPVTTSGTLTLTGAAQSANQVLASPNGSGGALAVRALVYADMPALSANQFLGALTGTTPTGQALPSCSGSGSALIYTSGTGFGCNTSLLISFVPGYGLTSIIGTQNTGAQTITNGGTLSPQLFPVVYAADHNLATIDAGQLDLANGGSSINFVMLNPGTATGNAYQFGDQSAHGFVLQTVGGSASIQGNFSGGSATSQTLPANSAGTCVDFATVYSCAVVYGDYARLGAVQTFTSAQTISAPTTINSATFKVTTLAASTAIDTVCYTTVTGLFTEEPTGTTCIVSDERKKVGMKPISRKRSLDIVLGAKPISFYYRADLEDPGYHLGFGAQTLAKIAPELVERDADGIPNAVKQIELLPVTWAAMQQMQAEIIDLQRRVR